MGYERALGHWQKLFSEIYGQKNMAMAADQVAQRLVEEVGELVHPINTFNLREIKKSIADLLPWICGLATRLGIDLEEAMYHKYCEHKPGKSYGSLDMFALIGKKAPDVLEDWQDLLKESFKEENANITPPSMIAKLVQDIGATSRSLRHNTEAKALADKLAGVLGWTLAISNKFEINLAQITWEKYQGACWKCLAKPCRCTSLTRVFVSHASELESDREEVISIIKNRQIQLDVIGFQDISQFTQERMTEALREIAGCDGGVILLGSKFSPNVYAELLFMLAKYDPRNVWIFVKGKNTETRDPMLIDLIEEMKRSRQVHTYETPLDLQQKISLLIQDRMEELRQPIY